MVVDERGPGKPLPKRREVTANAGTLDGFRVVRTVGTHPPCTTDQRLYARILVSQGQGAASGEAKQTP